MKKSLPTLTIAIPAHNEATNLPYVLNSIISQRIKRFNLQMVIVMCDGCTDNTAKVARAFKAKLPQLQVFDDGKRMGKSGRLNLILKRNRSDFLFLLDADLLLDRPTEIERLMKPFSDPNVELVGAEFYPVDQENLLGKASRISFLTILEAALMWNDGKNFYTLVGGAQVLRRSLADRLSYPKGLVSDQSYTFAAATQHGLQSYAVAHGTRILCRTVNTFYDWRLLGTRSINKNKSDAITYFGKDVLADFTIPKKYYFMTLLHWFTVEPLPTLVSLYMNLIIRMFPLTVNMSGGTWDSTLSSKEAISK
ncbi:glycosyltransferase [Candidatus Woesebacteria bacterium]|nr:glycosyltransferase [Candidatus Woesebacteria bacterium]